MDTPNAVIISTELYKEFYRDKVLLELIEEIVKTEEYSGDAVKQIKMLLSLPSLKEAVNND